MRFTHVGNKCLHSVFPNQYSDTYFRIVSFICFLFMQLCSKQNLFRRNRTSNRFPTDSSTRQLYAILLRAGIVCTELRRQRRWVMPRTDCMEITFNVIFLIISFSDTRDPEVRRWFNSQPKILKLHFTQLVQVYIFPTLKFAILYFNFHLVQKQTFLRTWLTAIPISRTTWKCWLWLRDW